MLGRLVRKISLRRGSSSRTQARGKSLNDDSTYVRQHACKSQERERELTQCSIIRVRPPQVRVRSVCPWACKGNGAAVLSSLQVGRAPDWLGDSRLSLLVGGHDPDFHLCARVSARVCSRLSARHLELIVLIARANEEIKPRHALKHFVDNFKKTAMEVTASATSAARIDHLHEWCLIEEGGKEHVMMSQNGSISRFAIYAFMCMMEMTLE